jgi:hypothetical protein
VFLAGFSPREPLPETWHISVHLRDVSEAVVSIRKPGDFGSNWGGQFDGVQRFHKGYDLGVIQALTNSLLRRYSVNVSSQDDLRQLVETAVAPFEYQVPFAAMPIQEGIAYVKFLLDIAILQHRFVIGAPTCGGSIRIAVVRKHEGFEWVTPTRFTISRRG